jgi:ABC-2 type transport system ATP-binding protein
VGVISTQRLTKRYGRRVGIESIDLDVPSGALFGFLGPNGSGKTTTIRTLLGFLRPSTGAAQIFGLDCWTAGRLIRRDVGYLPGDLRLYPGWTARTALSVCSAIRRLDARAAGDRLAERLGLDPGVAVRRMSRGMRQKLGLILALAHDPRLLVLDEPTSSLDPLVQDQVLLLLRELASAGRTVFFSSHSLGEVERLCDRVAIVREGKLVADESLANLRARAPRQVLIRWAEGTDTARIEPAPGLELSRSDRHCWEGSLRGPVPGFLRWAHDKPLADLALGEPDLARLFRDYYERRAGEP